MRHPKRAVAFTIFCNTKAFTECMFGRKTTSVGCKVEERKHLHYQGQPSGLVLFVRVLFF